MTIEKTRELLGDEIQDFTDLEVLALIQYTGALVDSILDIFVRNHLTRKLKGVQNG